MRTVGIWRIGRITGRILLGACVATLSIGFAASFSFIAKCLGCVFVGGVVAIMISWAVSATIWKNRLKMGIYLGLSVLLGGLFGWFWAGFFEIDWLFPVVFGFWAGFIVACATGDDVLGSGILQGKFIGTGQTLPTLHD